MSRFRIAIGLCAICAALSVSVVQNAAAATNGTTGFTCKEVKGGPGTVGFKDAHCKETAEGEAVKYEHFAIPINTTTEGIGTNETTGGAKETEKLVSTISGVTVELQAKTVEGSGWGENKIAASGEHYAIGEAVTTLKEVAVTKPAEKGCKVKTGEVKTNKIKGTTLGMGMEGKAEPAEGTVFAAFSIEGCSIAALNGIYEVKGSIKCPSEGSTGICTQAATTAQGTLTMRGQKVGVEGTGTALSRDPALGEIAYTVVSGTTVQTP